MNRSIVEIETGPQVVETGSTGTIGSTSGYQWYRLYSDGFMIQGGLFTTSATISEYTTYYFYKAFSTPPIVLKNYYVSGGGTSIAHDTEVSVYDVTTTSFATYNAHSDVPNYFQYLACGY